MVGMLQILTYLLAVYLLMKGVEILQIALASSREKRAGMFVIAGLSVAICLVSALAFVDMQDKQAQSVGRNSQSP